MFALSKAYLQSNGLSPFLRYTLSRVCCFRQSAGFKNGDALPQIRGIGNPGARRVVLSRTREQFNVAHRRDSSRADPSPRTPFELIRGKKIPFKNVKFLLREKSKLSNRVIFKTKRLSAAAPRSCDYYGAINWTMRSQLCFALRTYTRLEFVKVGAEFRKTKLFVLSLTA